jgi:Fic family protein
LRTLGFKVNNELFELHSWYFRNALVRANFADLSKSIHANNEFLLRFFGNLLLGEKNVLKNREMHVHYIKPAEESSEKTVEEIQKGSEKTQKSSEKSSEKILRLIQQNSQVTIKELAEQIGISTRAIEKNIAKLKSENRIERIGGDKGGHWKVIEK